MYDSLAWPDLDEMANQLQAASCARCLRFLNGVTIFGNQVLVKMRVIDG